MRALALLDWDNTLSAGWTLVPWVAFLRNEGLVEASAESGLKELFEQHLQGTINHNQLAEQSADLYAQAVSGRGTVELKRLAKSFVSEKSALFPFVADLFKVLSGHHVEPVIISGAPAEVLYAHCGDLPCDRVFGLRLVEGNGRLTGRVLSNPGSAPEKARIVGELVSSGGSIFLSMGDSESDLPILQAARHNIVVDNTVLKNSLGSHSTIITRNSTGELVRTTINRFIQSESE